jgi:hypothetical protein
MITPALTCPVFRVAILCRRADAVTDLGTDGKEHADNRPCNESMAFGYRTPWLGPVITGSHLLVTGFTWRFNPATGCRRRFPGCYAGSSVAVAADSALRRSLPVGAAIFFGDVLDNRALIVQPQKAAR